MDQPLSSTEQVKILFFWIVLVLLVGALGIGVLLILLTLWGLYMSRKYGSFDYVVTVSKAHKTLAALGSIIFTLLSLFFWFWYGDYGDATTFFILGVVVFPIYAVLVNFLFYSPLSKHKEWVVANGVFSTSTTEPFRNAPWISVGKTALIADELLKLNTLKEANLITLEEFDSLRSKLLR
jgi:hypothetical protein